MEKWRQVWRDGLAPQLPLAGLRALLVALREDDPRLIQGVSYQPPASFSRGDEAVSGACAICFAGWRNGIGTVDEICDFFTEICEVSDAKYQEPVLSRYFINWFDATPREVMRREMIPEVELAIKVQEEKGGG